jgi:hypothetical protein
MQDPFTPVPVEGEISEEDSDLFGEYRHLLPILVEGMRCLVPEGTSVLRALQYLELKHESVKMDWGRYCWNNTEGCCEMEVRDQETGAVHTRRACQAIVTPRLEIVRLPKGGRLCRRSPAR